mmetsp:Transcript_21193/g.61646  ORF Transcript_21193/g.61646 Transcript_21193/m.61646 type:complete len:319 (-) Transcript_21193:19-975(-)
MPSLDPQGALVVAEGDVVIGQLGVDRTDTYEGVGVAEGEEGVRIAPLRATVWASSLARAERDHGPLGSRVRPPGSPGGSGIAVAADGSVPIPRDGPLDDEGLVEAPQGEVVPSRRLVRAPHAVEGVGHTLQFLLPGTLRRGSGRGGGGGGSRGSRFGPPGRYQRGRRRSPRLLRCHRSRSDDQIGESTVLASAVPPPYGEGLAVMIDGAAHLGSFEVNVPQVVMDDGQFSLLLTEFPAGAGVGLARRGGRCCGRGGRGRRVPHGCCGSSDPCGHCCRRRPQRRLHVPHPIGPYLEGPLEAIDGLDVQSSPRVNYTHVH